MGEQHEGINYFQFIGETVSRIHELDEHRRRLIHELLEEEPKKSKEFKFLSNEN